MNDTREQTFLFDADDATLVGIVSVPTSRVASTGVLVVVGGPQYRVGSHRQFVLLARALARRGIAAMRFDCAAMGDSAGIERSFTERDGEIRGAIDAFVRVVPSVQHVAIWGLCDAASAALMYAADDARVTRLVLLNPWVRSETGLAKAQLKHHYSAKLVDRTFWTRLVSGRVGLWRALREFIATWRTARHSAREPQAALTYQERMANGWKRFGGDILLICSGNDLTAREFLDHAASDPAWAGLVDAPRVSRRSFDEADHTFSRAQWRDQVATWTADWIIGESEPSSDIAPREAA
jgi:exosortase A-associated hydrolase 1